jgi:hypothetical protein
MFGSFAPALTGPRKPSQEWFFEDNKLTGINAAMRYKGAFGGLILPHGLSDEVRDLALWAFECGHTQGQHEGEESIQQKFRQLMRCERS